MTQLRQRMIEDMQLRGYSARTQEAYARSVRQLAKLARLALPFTRKFLLDKQFRVVHNVRHETTESDQAYIVEA